MKFITRPPHFIAFFLLVTGLTCLWLSALTTHADAAPEPISIAADQMVSQERKNVVVFKGSVDASQGDLVIKSDKMTVYYSEKNNDAAVDKSSQVKKLICTGKVKITQGDWLGTGERMDYFAKERKVILSGNAKAFQGGNMVTGKTITYFLDEGRSIVDNPDTTTSQSGKQGGQTKPGRVKAVIQPEANSR